MGPQDRPPAGIDPRILRAWAALERRKQQARDDLSVFASTVCLNQEGKPLDLSWVGHHQWYRHLSYCWTNNLRCMIVAPMNHGKTQSLIGPLVAWLIGNNPQNRIKVVCASDAAAAERVNSIKDLIETPTYREVFPGVKPGGKWTAHELYVKRKGIAVDPTLHARGVETRGMGSRADVIVFDDVCDVNNSAEPAQREKIRNRVLQLWLTRIEAGSPQVCWVGTPWHVDDATHHLMNTPGWGVLVQKAWGLDKDCAAHDLELTLNPVPGQTLPPYPAPPDWKPGDPPPPVGQVKWIQP